MKFSVHTIYVNLIALILAVIAAVSCKHATPDNAYNPERNIQITTPEQADSIIAHIKNNPKDIMAIRALLFYYTQYGEFGKLAEESKEILANSGNTELYDLAATYLAYSYVKMNIPDSARKYLDKCAGTITENSQQYTLYHNIEAEYALKFEMNYTNAIQHLKMALDHSEKTGKINNQIILLGNIASVYNLRNDTNGLKYARESYRLSEKDSDSYSRSFSIVTLASNEALAGNYTNAIKYAEEAIGIINSNPALQFLLTTAYTTIANSYMSLGKMEEAEKAYNTAFRYQNLVSDENVHLQLLISYASFLMETKRYEEAKEHFTKALSLTEKNDNIDYRYKIYEGLANIYDYTGQKDSAFKYMQLYANEYNAIFNMHKEREFNQLFLDYEKVKYENSLQKQQLEVARTKRIMILAVSAFLIAAIIIIALYTVYRKRNNMYTLLVAQHQQLLQERKLDRIISEKETEPSDQTELQLFKRMEDLMNEKKLYRNNEISLAMIAEELGSNRTYISTIINKYSGKTFHNYINSYRINEAISLISDTDKEIVLKALCDEIGYNSMSCFYRAFQKETGCTPMIYRDRIMKMKKEEKKPEAES